MDITESSDQTKVSEHLESNGTRKTNKFKE